MSELDELFTGAKVGGSQSRPAAQTAKPPVPKAKPTKLKPDIKPEVKPIKEQMKSRLKEMKEEPEEVTYVDDTPIESVEKACGGNKYLEAMVMGEILNSPKFKNHRRY